MFKLYRHQFEKIFQQTFNERKYNFIAELYPEIFYDNKNNQQKKNITYLKLN